MGALFSVELTWGVAEDYGDLAFEVDAFEVIPTAIGCDEAIADKHGGRFDHAFFDLRRGGN